MPTTISGNSITTTGDINSTTTGTAGSQVGRNKIIGGDFSTNPWQRGTSFTAPADSAYTADRFQWRNVATTAVVNILKTLDAPTAVQAGVFTQHCLHVDITTADTTIAAGEVSGVLQRIEGANAAAFGFGQPGTRFVTLSFWHKHTKTGTYCVALRNAPANRSYVVEYSQDVSDAWEFHQMRIPVDTTGTWLYDNGAGIEVYWVLASGTTFQTTANTWQAGNFVATANQVNALDNVNNNFKIALVQLEPGEVATDFEALDVGTVLARCQRYTIVYGNPSSLNEVFANGFALSATSANYQLFMPISMRTTPTGVFSAANTFNNSDGVNNTVATSISLAGATQLSKTSVVLAVGVASGLTAFRPYRLEAQSTSATSITLSAEL
jgi:hypothetical protein